MHLDYLKKCQVAIILNFEDDNGAGDPVAEVHPLAIRVNLQFGGGLDYNFTFIIHL